MRLTGIQKCFKSFWKSLLSTNRKLKAFILTAIVALSALIGITLYNPPRVGIPSGVGDLNVTDLGATWRIDWPDGNGNIMRLNIYENPNDGSWQNVLSTFYNLTYSSTESFSPSGFMEVADEASITRGTIEAVINSSMMFVGRWPVSSSSAAHNVSGHFYIVVYKNQPWFWLAWNCTVTDYASGDLRVQTNVDIYNGWWDDDGSNYAASYGASNNYGYHIERGRGIARTVFGADKGTSNINPIYYYDIGATDNNDGTIQRLRDYVPSVGDLIQGSVAHWIFNGTTSDQSDIANQWYFSSGGTDATLNSSTVSTGTWCGWNYPYCAYEVEASSKVAEWVINGYTGVTYDPVFRVTNLNGNTSNYIFKRNGTTLTRGTDYYSYWESTNGTLWIWLNSVNDKEQTFRVEESQEETISPVISHDMGTYYRVTWIPIDGVNRSIDIYNATSSTPMQLRNMYCDANGDGSFDSTEELLKGSAFSYYMDSDTYSSYTTDVIVQSPAVFIVKQSLNGSNPTNVWKVNITSYIWAFTEGIWIDANFTCAANNSDTSEVIKAERLYDSDTWSGTAYSDDDYWFAWDNGKGSWTLDQHYTTPALTAFGHYGHDVNKVQIWSKTTNPFSWSIAADTGDQFLLRHTHFISKASDNRNTTYDNMMDACYDDTNDISMDSGTYNGFGISGAFELDATNNNATGTWVNPSTIIMRGVNFIVSSMNGVTSVTVKINGTTIQNGSDCIYSIEGDNLYLSIRQIWSGNTTFSIVGSSENTSPSVNSPSDQSWTYGTSPHTIGWVVIDAEQSSGSYTVYKNGTTWDSGTWNNNSAIDTDIADLPAGNWNMTIKAIDGQGGSDIDTVYVDVSKATPSLECYLNETASDKDYTVGEKMNLTGTIIPAYLTVVVEFTNGTDISTPSSGSSTSIEDSSLWGVGTYYIQSHTDGNANYTAANSTTRTITISTGNTAPTINSPSDQTNDWGTSPHTIGWIVTDAEQTSGSYTVYRNSSFYGSGTWNNHTSIDFDVSRLPEGYWKMHIDASDGASNVTDDVYVNVTDNTVKSWIESMQQDDNHVWGPRNITFDVLNNKWISENTNSYDTSYAIASLKSMQPQDILYQTDVINTIKSWQSSSTGQFNSGLSGSGSQWVKVWDHYWCTWALDMLGDKPTYPTLAVDWINNLQDVYTNEAYWLLDSGVENPYTHFPDRFSNTFAAVMSILNIDGTTTSNISNWAKVKAYFDNRQNPDGGWDDTNASESNMVPRTGYVYGNRSYIPYTWMAVEVYHAAGLSIPNSADVISFVRASQSEDGGWGYWNGDNSTNIMCTYAAIRTLDILGSSPADVAEAENFIKSCEGYSPGFAWRPGLMEITEATFYGVESLNILNKLIPNNGTSQRWLPQQPVGNIYTWQVETYGFNSGAANDPSGAAAEFYYNAGFGHVSPKNPADTGRIDEANDYADKHGLGINFSRSYEDYGTNPWFVGIPFKYDHCHDWMNNPNDGSPTTAQDLPFETHVTSMVDSVKNNNGMGGFYMPATFIDAMWMDYKWKENYHRTGEFVVYSGHYWHDPWYTGSNPGVGPFFERWHYNRTAFPNADAHKGIWRDGDTHAFMWRGVFIAPNNTIEGLKYAVKNGWTASVATFGSGYPTQKYVWNPSTVWMWGYDNVVEYLYDNLSKWQWWGSDHPIENILVYPISNGTKNAYDYDNKASNESSTWNTDRDGALFRVYYHSPSNWVTIKWISIGTEKWTKNITPTTYLGDWDSDDPDYADYIWFEDTSLPMGLWNVTVCYKAISETSTNIYTRTFDIGSIPAPRAIVKNAAKRTIANGVVIDLDVISSSPIQSFQYKWDTDSYTSLSSPYDLSVSGLSDGSHTLHIRVSDGNYTEEYSFTYTVATTPTLSGFWVGNKTYWDEDYISSWYDIFPSFPPCNGNATIYALLYDQTAPKVVYEKRYAQYSKIFNQSYVSMTSMGTYDSYFTLWAANISVAPGMNVTYWIMYDDSTNSSKKWFKALPDPFQSFYGLGLLESWSEDNWSPSTLLDKLDEVSASFVIPITTWGQTSTNYYYFPFQNSTDLFPLENGYFKVASQNFDAWKSELDSRDPYRTKYTISWFFYHRTFRDETPLNVPGPRSQEEWNAIVDKVISIMASDPSFLAFVLDQEYASYHETKNEYKIYRDWDDNGDLVQNSTEWESHIVQTFLDRFRKIRWIEYGGQPHFIYRWNSHIIPERAYVRASVNHFQHCDRNGGYPNYFRQLLYALAGYEGNSWTPGLFTFGVSPAANDLAMDYKLHWTNETHGTSTEWTDFGFADQILYTVLNNPRYTTLWVHGAWDDTTEPYAFDLQEKQFANRSAKLINTVPYICNLTYVFLPYGNNLSDLWRDERGTKPPWFSTNASNTEGPYFSLTKETGSMYQITVSNFQKTPLAINITIGSGLFNDYGVTKMVAFNASDGSSWTKLNNTSGERSFVISLQNSSFAIFKFGIPFEVLGLPFDYDGWNWTDYSNYPSLSNITVNSFDWNDLNITVNSPFDQFFKFYVPSGDSWTLEVNGLSYDSTNTLSVSSAPSKLGLLSAGEVPSENTDPTINSPSDQEWAEGTTGHTIGWIVSDADDGSGPYTVYKNTKHGSGTWIDTVSIDYDIDGTSAGYWNFTITATDGHGGSNATDTVWVNVTSVNNPPSINSPSDQQWVNGTTGHTIGWIITDGEQTSGAYTIYKNGTKRDSGTWNNATSLNYNIDGLGYGYWNLTIDATDGYENVTDIVWVNVTANLTFTPSLYPPGVTTLNVTGNIEDFPVNLTPTGQTDTYAIFKIDWIDGADYEYGAIDVNFSSIPSGVVFYLDDDSDFSSAVAWNSTDYGTTKEVIDHTVATDPDYIWMKVYMPANQGGFSFTVYFWSREDG